MARDLLWLQKDPDVTAKSLLERLHQQYPGQFPEGSCGPCSGALGSGGA